MYRVRSKCERCKLIWTSRKKRTKNAPVRCPDCGSYATNRLSYWKVKGGKK